MTKLLTGLFFVFVLHCAALAQDFVPKLQINQKELIDEALAKLLEHDPSLKASDLEVSGLSYQFQPMPGTVMKCGPEGCKWVEEAPFSERLCVEFRIKSSERKVSSNGRETLLSNGISVQFPDHRQPKWFFNSMTYSKQLDKESTPASSAD